MPENTDSKTIGKNTLGHNRPAGKSRILPVKMPESLRSDIEEAASARGLTVSEWVRQVCQRAARRITRR